MKLLTFLLALPLALTSCKPLPDTPENRARAYWLAGLCKTEIRWGVHGEILSAKYPYPDCFVGPIYTGSQLKADYK